MEDWPSATGESSHLGKLVLETPFLEVLPPCFGRDLRNLKDLELLSCWSLKRLPDSFLLLDQLMNIEELPSATGESSHLEVVLETPFLEALPPSFGRDLRNLKYLKLRSCQSLKRLSDSFLVMDQLIKLIVEECPLQELPFETVEGGSETMTGSGGQRTLSNLERRLLRLQHLGLHKTQISEISFPTGVYPELQYLAIRDCQDLVEVGTLPNALRGPHLIDCPKLSKIERLSGFVKCLLHLQHLELHNTAISEVSFATGVCPYLQHLNIKDCEGLIEVRTLPNALIILELDNCPKLKLMSIADLAQVMQMREIRVHLCNGLEELLGVGHMKSLEVLQASGCAKLKSILGLDQLTQLIILDVPFNLC